MASEPLSIATVRSQIVGVEQRVPVLDGSERPYINLDNAASTPALRPVWESVNAFLPWYSSVHRGAGFKSQLSTRAYERAREAVLRFLGADPGEHVVIFGRNTTEAINKLARRFPLQEGDVVLLSLMEHHSNDLPWRGRARVERIRVTEEGELDEDHFDHLLRRFAGRVRLLVISGASNVTGYVNPIYRLARKVHEVGGQILVDAAQLAPHRKIIMGRLEDPAHLDYVALSAHKMYAPFGTGALVGRRETFADGSPDLVGGGAISLVTVDDVAWAPLPHREEAGSPNVVGAVALAEAVRSLEAIGMDAIAEHEAALTCHALRRLREIDGLVLYGDQRPECSAARVGVISLRIPAVEDGKVAAILAYEAGIGVRHGCFCAQPYVFHLLGLKREEVARYAEAAARGERQPVPGLVRLSLGCYNTIEELDVAVEALGRVARGEYAGRYRTDAGGEYYPEGYEVEWERYFRL